MGKTYDAIPDDLAAFAVAQPIFFVATAPLSGEGHVNVSPKGLDTFRVLSPTRVAYLDLTGSGNETSAHLLENGRITIMFCAFVDPPRILRLQGRGRVVLPHDPEAPPLLELFGPRVGTRQIVVVDVTRVSTSCGYGVPRMELVGPRDKLDRWAEAKGEEGLAEYRRRKNLESIDGLPTHLAKRDA